MTHADPVPNPTARHTARYDTDPDALAWARTRVQHQLDRLAAFEARAAETGKTELAAGLSMARRSTQQLLLGGEGCVVGAFDERRPVMFAAATPATPSRATDCPIHEWFGLTYSNYLVLNRTLLQSMTPDWQQRMVTCLEELSDAFAHIEQPEAYAVQAGEQDLVNELTEAEMEQLGITCQEYDDEPPAGLDGEALDAWQDEHRIPEPLYHDRDGDEIDGDSYVIVPTWDPVPHYNRGRTYIQPATPTPDDADGIPATDGSAV
jgi:hypothetical protein